MRDSGIWDLLSRLKCSFPSPDYALVLLFSSSSSSFVFAQTRQIVVDALEGKPGVSFPCRLTATVQCGNR